MNQHTTYGAACAAYILNPTPGNKQAMLDAGKDLQRADTIARLACDGKNCGWRGDSATVLRAPDPFNAGWELMACPKCRDQTIRTTCDEPDCWEQDTCGTPTPNGYRRTCGRHTP